MQAICGLCQPVRLRYTTRQAHSRRLTQLLSVGEVYWHVVNRRSSELRACHQLGASQSFVRASVKDEASATLLEQSSKASSSVSLPQLAGVSCKHLLTCKQCSLALAQLKSITVDHGCNTGHCLVVCLHRASDRMLTCSRKPEQRRASRKVQCIHLRSDTTVKSVLRFFLVALVAQRKTFSNKCPVMAAPCLASLAARSRQRGHSASTHGAQWARPRPKCTAKAPL